MLKNMKIGTRLTMAFGLVLMLLLVNGMVAIYNIGSVERSGKNAGQ